MPPNGYATVSLPKELVERWKRARQLIAKHGLSDLPADVQPAESDRISNATTFEVGVAFIEQFYRKRGK
jgi:hypothetical protein